ncbi:MAG TPA: hypothetical protein VIJ44_02790 [Acidimicrobiia bacterium]
MVAQPRSRADVASRLAHRLGIEFHSDLLEIVPPVAWDEFPTRDELGEALRARDEHLDRRLRAIRDALAAAHHDQARQLVGRALALALAGVVAASAALVRSRHGSGSVTGRARDHGGSCAGQREALHRRRVG